VHSLALLKKTDANNYNLVFETEEEARKFNDAAAGLF
jgi:hypothetical protein